MRPKLAIKEAFMSKGLDSPGGAPYYTQHVDAGWSSLVARRAHNPKVIGSNPVPATKHRKKPVPQGTGFFVGSPPCRSPPFSPLPLESRTRHPHLVDKSTRSRETRPCLSSIRAPANPSPPTPPPATPARPPPAPTRCPR